MNWRVLVALFVVGVLIGSSVGALFRQIGQLQSQLSEQKEQISILSDKLQSTNNKVNGRLDSIEKLLASAEKKLDLPPLGGLAKCLPIDPSELGRIDYNTDYVLVAVGPEILYPLVCPKT